MRFVLATLLFATVIAGPWWIALGLALALSLRWHAWEVLLAGAVFDVLYATSGGFWGIPVLGTLVGLFFLFVFMPLRERLMAE